MSFRMVRPDGPKPAVAPIATALPVPPQRDVIAVEGPDAVTFLQGQLSQDIAALPVGQSSWTLLLQPQGKVQSWLGVRRDDNESVLLDVDAGYGDAVVERLSRFLIRTKATVAVTARDVVLDPSAEPATDAERIAAGVPAMGAELTENTIPAEVGQWFVDASVSFTKGCYTGQELVARVDSRGSNVPRHLRVLTVADDVEVPVGAEVVADDGSVVGAVTSSAPGLALAYVKRAVAPPATVTVRWDGDLAAATI
jgi:folate-binding protein YgfZ